MRGSRAGGGRRSSERLDEILDVLIRMMQGDFDVELEIGERGDVFDGIAAGLNITAEELGFRSRELETQREFLRAIFESAAESLIVCKDDGAIIDVNGFACVALGYSRDELLSMSVSDLQVGIEPFDVIGALERGHAVTVEGIHRRKDGTEFPVEVRVGRVALPDRGVVLAMARDISERRQAERLRRSFVERVEEAQEEERRRVSHELHDALGQVLTALSVQVKALEARLAPHGLEAEVAPLKELTEVAITETSRMARRLRPPALDELGFVAALEGHAETWSRLNDLDVDVLVHGLDEEERLPTAVETALYRVAQEALSNVAKHADCSTASVVIDCQPQRVRLLVEDDGRGFEVDSRTGLADDGEGLGLAGMRERAALLGGRVDFESRPGQGTTVSFTLPLQEPRS